MKAVIFRVAAALLFGNYLCGRAPPSNSNRKSVNVGDAHCNLISERLLLADVAG
jgi:hypothetical protein